MNTLISKKITFTYDNVEVDWNFSNTFNLYFIDEIGERDFREVDCFSAMNIKTIEQLIQHYELNKQSKVLKNIKNH